MQTVTLKWASKQIKYHIFKGFAWTKIFSLVFLKLKNIGVSIGQLKNKFDHFGG